MAQLLLDNFAWADPALRQQLERDPLGFLRERGLNVPADLPLHVAHECVRIISLLWVDGRIVPFNQFHIDPWDEGLLFGRGLWESTRTRNGVPWLWPLHLDRLIRTAKILDIPLDAARLPDTNQAAAYVRSLGPQDVVLRLNVTAGRPGRYGMIWMSANLRPMPKESVRLKTQISRIDPKEQYQVWKTFQYAGRLRTSQQAFEGGFDTALMLSAEGNLLEASHANIFLKLPEGWVTPSRESGVFLPGTLRQLLLDEAPIKFAEIVISKTRLSEATEVFVTNSNVGIVPVTQIDEMSYTIGPDTKSLMAWLDPKGGVSVSGPK